LERPRIIDARNRVLVALHPFKLPDPVRSVKGIPIYNNIRTLRASSSRIISSICCQSNLSRQPLEAALDRALTRGGWPAIPPRSSVSQLRGHMQILLQVVPGRTADTPEAGQIGTVGNSPTPA
jgi:hypothetical protein